ncbi:fumarylacetoacetate hydrolase family protein [Pseudidiomarina terrestris]|uniref:Fumarylacetoacetate hydrolase family protein n=1 Tax=Pseudidiomarina terrestris TaxID=2820060 RepID=A0AAW7QZ50_9GAMM|nr:MULTISPECIES: fumarylacetoacetate hydrolase family protein [unclassified Pseudidiomarina]MDN7123625.1 fumarylacetoacetate hydrolase family protein [Pseudidiomarina sp. 1APP75-32.1]MDN7126585.1 fumarylacetoacetate hydrolase family protein [Pseudidiomarina sp. 1APR75-33.1]MDN7128651.1 fumarylacetoacetate hydrolase family protein [Pseudidiomarina sp. 1APR75-15]MDN7135090.1 fumarylacetoacetate hydrolase family protein [Pseudidiomarina sp. 1ASP75-5]MDN7137761.1 fumarylacetoacetate hydrolase fami
MKFATYRNGTRDGQLMVVSRDLTKAVAVPALAETLQEVLDDWDGIAPELENVYSALNNGELDDAVAFDESLCESPLPRAYQWADGSAYVNHVELVRRARNAEMPPSFWTDPLMYQGGSDDFLGPKDVIEMGDTAWGIDFEGEVAIITDDVPMGVEASKAGQYIRLLMLVNDVSLRGLIPNELGKGFGFFQSKPSSAFSPVAVTPDELGDAWRDNKVHLPLLSEYNGQPFGKPNAGEDMTFDFAQLVAHAAKTRHLSAGAIIGSGTVSNKQGTDHGSAIAEGGVGYSCIAEVRMIETIRDGKPSTGFMQFGDTIKIEMNDADGKSIFGSIDQKVLQYQPED